MSAKKIFFGLFPILLVIGFFFYLNQQNEQSITIAILDTGIDTNVNDLEHRLFKNSNETLDQIDNDQNGYVDDTQGWNFVTDLPDATDENGHGTDIATAIFEQNKTAHILNLKVSHHGTGVTPEILTRALKYALFMGARVINVSFGLSVGSETLRSVLEEATQKNVIVVMAAGVGIKNPYVPGDLNEIYPQSYRLGITVGSLDKRGNPHPGSNFGDRLDFVLQPENGSFLNQKTNTSSSLASAVMSAKIAKILAKNPRFGLNEVKSELLKISQKDFDVSKKKYFGNGIIKFKNANF